MMLPKKKIKVLLGILGFALLTACSDPYHYDKFYAFDQNEWPQSVRPKFEIEIEDTSLWYDFVISLRTTTDYGFSNLWIMLNTETPSGIKAREPFQIRIADEKGAWLGIKSGTVVENNLLFRKRKFPEKGTYTFIVEQGITQETIDEVLNVGIRMTSYSEPAGE